MLTEKDYCDYDTCVTLGDLGFPLKRMKVRNYLNGELTEDTIVLTLLYEAQKWLREEKKIHVEVHIAFNKYFYELFKTDEYDKHFGIQKVLVFGTNEYKSHEEALLEGIKEAIKLLKEEK